MTRTAPLPDRRWPLAALAVATAAVVLGGCASSSDYPANADAICRRYAVKMSALPPLRSVSQIAGYVSTAKRAFETGVAKLERVKVPRERRAAYDAYVSTLRSEVGLLARARAAAATSPREALTVLASAADVGRREATEAAAAGLRRCGV